MKLNNTKIETSYHASLALCLSLLSVCMCSGSQQEVESQAIQASTTSSGTSSLYIGKTYENPLFEAVANGDEVMVRALLDGGASVHMKEKFSLYTPLHYACFRNKPDILALLIQRGAKIDARTDLNDTALHIAAGREQLECCKLLIDAGADVNARDNMGKTPLLELCRSEHQDPTIVIPIIELLLDAGADVNARDEAKQTAYMNISPNKELMGYLQSKGANTSLKGKRIPPP